MNLSAWQFAKLKREHKLKLAFENHNIDTMYPDYIKHDMDFFMKHIDDYLKSPHVKRIWENSNFVVIQIVKTI